MEKGGGEEFTIGGKHKNIMQITLTPNSRGFMQGQFSDLYGEKCSIQHSSLATDNAIWLGIDEVELKILARDAVAIGRDDLLGEGAERFRGWVDYPVPDCVLKAARMHLNQEQVAALIPLLQYFVEHGELPRSNNREQL